MNNTTLNTEYTHDELKAIWNRYHESKPALAEIAAELMILEIAQREDEDEVRQVFISLQYYIPADIKLQPDIRRFFDVNGLIVKAQSIKDRELVMRERAEGIRRLESTLKRLIKTEPDIVTFTPVVLYPKFGEEWYILPDDYFQSEHELDAYYKEYTGFEVCDAIRSQRYFVNRAGDNENVVVVEWQGDKLIVVE